MSTYVLSDVHGETGRFRRMLKTIGFGTADTLYILGDVIDRGPDGIELLREIAGDPRMHMILGNHEHMCLRYHAPDATEAEKRRWNRNRNYPTLAGIDALAPGEWEKLLAFLRTLPDHALVTVGGRQFLLVHGFWAESTYDRVWSRPKADTPPVFDDRTVIIGHTPVWEYVCTETGLEDLYVYSRRLTEKGDHFRIFRTAAFTDIDCCCGYGFSAGRLACLRLDDGQEFYE